MKQWHWLHSGTQWKSVKDCSGRAYVKNSIHLQMLQLINCIHLIYNIQNIENKSNWMHVIYQSGWILTEFHLHQFHWIGVQLCEKREHFYATTFVEERKSLAVELTGLQLKEKKSEFFSHRCVVLILSLIAITFCCRRSRALYEFDVCFYKIQLEKDRTIRINENRISVCEEKKKVLKLYATSTFRVSS